MSQPPPKKAPDKLDVLLSTLVDGVITIDDKGVVDSFNPAAERIFGYTADEVIGQNISVLMPEPYHSQHDAYIHNYIHTGKAKIIGIGREVSGKRKNGSLFPLDLAVGSFVIDGQMKFVGTIRDISDRKLYEEARENLLTALTQANTELERFAYIASHDMQEPLRMISNFSKLIATEYRENLDDAGKEYLNFVLSASGRMQALIADLLEYSRLNTGPVRLDLINTEEIVTVALQNLATSIVEKQADITFEKLPQVRYNTVQCMRLFQNLLANAIKFQPRGQKPVVQIKASGDAASHWTFSISDNGIGMREDQCSIIFDPFKRLHSWDSYKGSGIGLSACRKIVENHGGKIWVTSTPGKGSTFWFTVPKHNEDAA